MNRRDFFKRIGLGSALIATSQLPAQAEDNPSVFPKRGRFEQLSLSMVTVEIGLPKPFSVLHISDTHLTAAYPHESQKKQKLHQLRTQTFGGRQEEALQDSLAWARQHVDYIVHTGDLIDWQSEANYDLARKYFGQSIIGCVGNHEYSPDMWLSEPKETATEDSKAPYREQLQRAYPFDISFYAREAGGVNFVALDDVFGTVTEQQVERFRQEVAKGLPIVMCLHVPLFTDAIYRANHHFWAKTDLRFTNGAIPSVTGDYLKQQTDPVTADFISYLKQLPQLKAILCGHLHFTTQDRFSPTAMEYVVGGNFLFHGQEVLFV